MEERKCSWGVATNPPIGCLHGPIFGIHARPSRVISRAKDFVLVFKLPALECIIFLDRVIGVCHTFNNHRYPLSSIDRSKRWALDHYLPVIG